MIDTELAGRIDGYAPNQVLLVLVAVRFAHERISSPISAHIPQAGGFIGRAEGATMVLPDVSPFDISRRHCAIVYSDNAFFAVDESRNGTFLNDRTRRVSRKRGTPLANGDRLIVGAYEIMVMFATPAELAQRALETEEDGRHALLAGLGSAFENSDVPTRAIVASCSSTLMKFADVIFRLRMLREDSIASIGPAESSETDEDRKDSFEMTTRQIALALLERPREEQGERSIDTVLSLLCRHQKAFATAATAGPKALDIRWSPAAIGVRCDRLYRFTGPESLERKKKCMELLEEDFPDATPAETPPEGAPEPAPPFDPDRFAREKGVRAYRKTLARAAVSPAGAFPPPPVRTLVLTVVRIAGKPVGNGEARGVLRGSSGSIGRGKSATLSLPDTKRLLSRVHTEIVWAGGEYTAFDRSKNGTFLNTRRHRLDGTLGRRLEDGDHLLIGEHEIHVSLSGGDLATGLASYFGSALIDGFVGECGLSRADLPSVEPRELFSILAWRLDYLGKWLDALEFGRRRVRAHLTYDLAKRRKSKMALAGERDQAVAKTVSTLDATDIRARADVILRQEEAIAKAFGISLADAVRDNSPLRFLDEVEKRTVYRADTFWGQIFLGQQRKQAWDLFVKEKDETPYRLPGSLFRMNFMKMLQTEGRHDQT